MNMKVVGALICFSLGGALVGCASSPTVKESYAPSGKASYQISCNNMSASLAPCYQKAGEICKEKGYSVINRHADAPFASIIAECN